MALHKAYLGLLGSCKQKELQPKSTKERNTGSKQACSLATNDEYAAHQHEIAVTAYGQAMTVLTKGNNSDLVHPRHSEVALMVLIMTAFIVVLSPQQYLLGEITCSNIHLTFSPPIT